MVDFLFEVSFLKCIDDCSLEDATVLIPRLLRPLLDLADSLQQDRVDRLLNPEDGLIEKVFSCLTS